MWHQKIQDLVTADKLNVICVIQEQHADRCQLFMQWHGIDWPVLHDPINLLGSTAVPLFVAIDEHGIVRSTSATPEWVRKEFVNKSFEKTDARSAAPLSTDVEGLMETAQQENSAEAWRNVADAQLLWGKLPDVRAAIKTYQKSLRLAPSDAVTNFRLGVAYRMRYDSEYREPGDFQKAIDHWQAALDANPNQYIYRRRIQQYGPRLEKPYSFYDWIHQARMEITEAGKTPFPVLVEPSGAEFAHPAKQLAKTEDSTVKEPDPKNRIRPDKKSMVTESVVVVPAKIKPGKSARVHVELAPSVNAHWNNEAGPTVVWIKQPDGWQISQQRFDVKGPAQAESRETRRVEFEVLAPKDADDLTLEAYVLYFACHDEEGICIYARRDIKVAIEVE